MVGSGPATGWRRQDGKQGQEPSSWKEDKETKLGTYKVV